MKYFWVVATVMMLLAGCSRGQGSLFPADQEAACNRLFQAAEELRPISETQDCEPFIAKLIAVPDETFDRLESGLIDCEYSFMGRSKVPEKYASRLEAASDTIEGLLHTPCSGMSEKIPVLKKLSQRLKKIKESYQTKADKVKAAEKAARERMAHGDFEPYISTVCEFFDGLDDVMQSAKDDCDRAAALFDQYMDKHLQSFELAFDKMPGLFDSDAGTKAYQKCFQCFQKIVYQNSTYSKCIQKQNVNFIYANARMMRKPLDIQRKKLQMEYEDAQKNGTYDPKVLEKHVEMSRDFDPYLPNICKFFDDLANVLNQYEGKCDEMAKAHQQFLNTRQKELDENLDKAIGLLESNEGMTQLMRCIEKIEYHGSPYMICIASSQNLQQTHIQMLSHYSELYLSTRTHRLKNAGDFAAFAAEKDIIQSFKEIVEVPDVTCEELGKKWLKAWISEVSEIIDYLGSQSITQKINRGSENDIKRRKLIQDTFGKDAAVHKCMYVDEVRMAYERMVHGLKLEGFLEL